MYNNMMPLPRISYWDNFQVGGSLKDRTGQLVEGSGGQDISPSDVPKHAASDVVKYAASENGWIWATRKHKWLYKIN